MLLAEKAGSRLRQGALLVLGALAVHESRYLLAYGAHADRAQEAGGHAYLDLLAPLLVAVAAATVAVSLVAPAIHRRLPRIADPASATERAAAFAAVLLAIFICQELAEGLLSGSPAGVLGGIAGPGGWLALPLAIVFGALVEGARHWLERAETRVVLALVGAALLPRAPGGLALPASPAVTPICSRPMAFGISRRPPPFAAL